MNYKETCDYLFSHLLMYQRIGAAAYKPDLTNTLAFCNLLKNPQQTFRSVHIAGTNGKGSVSHMLASVLQEKGLKTGLYTSPHLTDFRERIRVNGVRIPEEKVIRFVENHKPAFEKLGLSFFEMTVGLAFDFFRDEKVDVAVIEVGMGGRLDATNIITPLLSVITNISFDHKQFLGDTLEKIAFEKAGIIKHGIPVVIGETQEEPRKVFLEKARQEQAPVRFADQEFSAGNIRNWQPDNEKIVLDIYRKNNLHLANLESPLGGNYQVKNILTVCAACEVLAPRLDGISEDNIRNGIGHVIRNTGFAGRWQLLSREPLTLCDTCHNEAGLQQVLDQIRNIPHEQLHFVFGMVNDKEIDQILQILPKNATYYFCKADIPRGLDAHELRNKATEYGLAGKVFGSVGQALKSAQENAGENDLVFVGGSIFVVAEVV
ncbi:MAG: bifunctional folylpolyglutamate synthase/dihydrofolate synthase [Bacteroidetes bacterium]|nr:bifunctional folylpolyglutamate synthase/dihydrofolate synthase [Bacteroidota bacterium]